MPAGRPNENRVKLTIYVKEETAEAINAAVDKSEPDINTQGKIVDRAFAKTKRKKTKP